MTKKSEHNPWINIRRLWAVQRRRQKGSHLCDRQNGMVLRSLGLLFMLCISNWVLEKNAQNKTKQNKSNRCRPKKSWEKLALSRRTVRREAAWQLDHASQEPCPRETPKEKAGFHQQPHQQRPSEHSRFKHPQAKGRCSSPYLHEVMLEKAKQWLHLDPAATCCFSGEHLRSLDFHSRLAVPRSPSLPGVNRGWVGSLDHLTAGVVFSLLCWHSVRGGLVKRRTEVRLGSLKQ